MLRVDIKKQQGDFNINVGFSAGQAGVTALFGSSGAGKTSIVNMVAGLSRPDDGRIVMNGQSWFDSKKKINIPPEKRRIGYVFQDARLFPHLSVQSNLTYGMGWQKGKLNPYIRFDRVVELLGIEPLLNRRPAKLSGGEKQRVAIGRALLCSPVLLLMDEPLASLDQDRKTEVLPFIRKLCKNFSIPILYVSHHMDEITTLADHLVLLDKGRAAAAGPLENFTSKFKDSSVK
jgi:molybdate transport system ATP-binding protein